MNLEDISMSRPEIYTAWKRPVDNFEVHNDEGIVERDGFLTIEQQVDRLMEAGARLAAFRLAEFRSDSEIPDEIEGSVFRNRIDLEYEAKVIRDNKERKKAEMKKEEVRDKIVEEKVEEQKENGDT